MNYEEKTIEQLIEDGLRRAYSKAPDMDDRFESLLQELRQKEREETRESVSA